MIPVADPRRTRSDAHVTYKSGRHFLQLPGPTNTPDRVLRATARATIDHRGPEFVELTHRLLDGLRWLMKTEHAAFLYPASGSGGWEAAIVNTLSPGDRVVAFDQGFFAENWVKVAQRFGLDVQVEPWDLRRGLGADAVRAVLDADAEHAIKAVLVVHNDTSTGVTSDLAKIGAAARASGHPALLMVDAVSSLAITDLRHDEWGVDVTVCGSQKGMMLPPGLALIAASPRALEAHGSAKLPRSYWDWSEQLDFNARGFFPYTPATNLMYGLDEALTMLREEGLDAVFARHARFASATRAAVQAWGLELHPADPCEASSALTAVLVPEGHDADALRVTILERFDMSLGTGLGRLKGKVFRIGHLGDLNPLTLVGALAGVEMGLRVAGVPHRAGGVLAAMDALVESGAQA
jgi:alanine-glyoxylate transaminase/serine-glyoxylate transaminase/serine-pyruvate transaminase